MINFSWSWIRKRWLEYRWGFNYIGLATGLYNILILTAIFLNVRADSLYLLFIIVSVPFVAVTWFVGRLHGQFQQRTDALLSYRPVFEEYGKITERVVRKIMGENRDFSRELETEP